MIGYVKNGFLNLFILNSCSFKNPVGFFDDRLADLKEKTYKRTQNLYSKKGKFTKEISNYSKKINDLLTL